MQEGVIFIMVPQKELSVFLLVFILLQTFDNAHTACTSVKLFVKAEYRESSVRETYTHTKITESSSSFKRNYNSVSGSASVSASYGGFSGSASASYNEVTESALAISGSRSEENTNRVTYDPGFNQIIQVITTTVTINGRSAKTTTRDIVDVVAEENSPSLSDLRNHAEEYIRYNFGDIPGGIVRQNTYEATACVNG